MAKFTYLDGSEWEDDLTLAPRDGTVVTFLRRPYQRITKHLVVTAGFNGTYWSVRSLPGQTLGGELDPNRVLGWRVDPPATRGRKRSVVLDDWERQFLVRQIEHRMLALTVPPEDRGRMESLLKKMER